MCSRLKTRFFVVSHRNREEFVDCVNNEKTLDAIRMLAGNPQVSRSQPFGNPAKSRSKNKDFRREADMSHKITRLSFWLIAAWKGSR
jgi:hypothetical protein